MLDAFSATLEACDPALGRFRTYRIEAGTDLLGELAGRCHLRSDRHPRPGDSPCRRLRAGSPEDRATWPATPSDRQAVDRCQLPVPGIEGPQELNRLPGEQASQVSWYALLCLSTTAQTTISCFDTHYPMDTMGDRSILVQRFII